MNDSMAMEGGSWLARGLRALILAKARRRPATEMAATPAIVFAPHQDDETLGCGGVIAAKREQGTPVTVVFFTDGAGRPPADASLAQQRREEAREACDKLGVDPSRVVFLDFPDGDLWQHLAAATDAALDLLKQHPEAELYIPHRHDGHPDHEAAAEAVLAACRKSGRDYRVFQYPVWLWHRYPVISNPDCRLRCRFAGLTRFATALLGARTVSVDIRNWLTDKQEALSCHVSQLHSHGSEGHGLVDVGDGAWLACLMSSDELFVQTSYDS